MGLAPVALRAAWDYAIPTVLDYLYPEPNKDWNHDFIGQKEKEFRHSYDKNAGTPARSERTYSLN